MKIQKDFIEAILDSIADGVFTVNQNFKITSFNKSAEKITGFTSKEALGKFCYEIFRSNICRTDCALNKTLKTGKNIVNFELNILTKDNKEIPVSISTAVLKNKSGNFMGGVETFRDISVIKELKKELTNKYHFNDIISQDKKMQKIFMILPDIAETDVTVLLYGDSGTGKELFATAIHNLSLRKDSPLIKVNCAAIPENLLESELFGYKKGAFTDAKYDKPGRFKLAEGGTIFLDEIGDLSMALQAKLLRVIQEKEFEEIGGTKTLKADVRIITATNKNLQKMVNEKKFREDLFYRLSVMKIEIPPLKNRREDIPLLIENFIKYFNLKHNKQIKSIDNDALNVLLNYDYPGNVRELQNIIEHSFILCKSSKIMKQHIPEYLKETIFKSKQSNIDIIESIKDLKYREVLKILRKNNYNKTKTAKELNIDRTTLWRWLKKVNT